MMVRYGAQGAYFLLPDSAQPEQPEPDEKERAQAAWAQRQRAKLQQQPQKEEGDSHVVVASEFIQGASPLL
jgi:hypothetical protein